MSEQPWPVHLDVPVRHVPVGARVARDDLASVRTAFVPRRIGEIHMARHAVSLPKGAPNPYRVFEGRLWARARFRPPVEQGPDGDVEDFRAFLLDPDRLGDHARTRWTVFSGGPLVPRIPIRDCRPAPRPGVDGLPTRGVAWDGTERVVAGALAFLRDEVVVCGDEVYVRMAGPLAFPSGNRAQVGSLVPAATGPGTVMVPLFVPVEAALGQRGRLMPFAVMHAGHGPGVPDLRPHEPLAILNPCRLDAIPRRLRSPGHDLRETALWAPGWTLGRLSRHASGAGRGRLRDALEPLAALDRTMRFGIAEADEVEAALRLSCAAIETAREVLGPGVLDRMTYAYADVLWEDYVPRLANPAPIPDEDVAAIAGL